MTNNKKLIFQSLVISIVTFTAFYVAIGLFLKNQLYMENIIAMIIFSTIIGLTAFGLGYFKLRIAFYLFVIGHFLGLILMANAYLSDVSGWEEIIGFLSYMIFLGGGLVGGLVIQTIYYIYKQSKLNKEQV